MPRSVFTYLTATKTNSNILIIFLDPDTNYKFTISKRDACGTSDIKTLENIGDKEILKEVSNQIDLVLSKEGPFQLALAIAKKPYRL